jgi:hypothetical protein
MSVTITVHFSQSSIDVSQSLRDLRTFSIVSIYSFRNKTKKFRSAKAGLRR